MTITAAEIRAARPTVRKSWREGRSRYAVLDYPELHPLLRAWRHQYGKRVALFYQVGADLMVGDDAAAAAELLNADISER